MLKLGQPFQDIYQLIEYLYIIGLHKEAILLANLAEKQDFLEKITQEYSAEDPNLDANWFAFKKHVGHGKNISLIGSQEYDFLAYSAFKLKPNSKILEIGTYHGGTTLALCEGSKTIATK